MIISILPIRIGENPPNFMSYIYHEAGREAISVRMFYKTLLRIR